MSKYVNIIVNSRLEGGVSIYTYLSDINNLQIGQIVLVPFGRRRLYGIVCDFIDQKPAYNLKKIIEIVLPQPVINQKQLKLAKFISDYYHCGLGQAVFSMIPGFLTGSILKTFSYAKNQPEKKINQTQKEIINFFIQNPTLEITEKIIIKKFGRSVIRDIAKLQSQGTITTRYKIKPPVASRKEIEILRLNHDCIDQKALEKIQKNSRQWEIYCYLEENPNANWLQLKNDLQVSKNSLNSLIRKKIIISEKQRIFRNPISNFSSQSGSLPDLNRDQDKIVKILKNTFANPEKPHFIFGRTGSGKTEIYLQMTEYALSQGKDVIVLVPEIALVPQTMERFSERFGSLLAIYHSQMSNGEKFDEWYRMYDGKAKIVIGSRSALFSPLKNIGLIIIDEEHESSFKQDSTPRYHAVTVAMHYSQILPAQLIIGSASPRLETFWQAKKNEYILHTINKTVLENIDPHYLRRPDFFLVDLRDEFISKNYSLISYTLANEIKSALADQKQILLYLNRRGNASYVFCRECGYVATCSNCSVSLTHHRYRKQNLLICHHCGHSQADFKTCPECSSEAIKFYGAGTQRLEMEINEMFPSARVLRMDYDTTRAKDSHSRIFNQFKQHKFDILIGTQMITKGWDIPNVDLAGIVNADAGFHLPDFRSTERNFSLLLQLAGRVGRFGTTGKVVIQTYEPENPLFDILTKEDYQLFAYSELIERKKSKFPPFVSVVRLLYADPDEKKCREESLRLFKQLNSLFLSQPEKDLEEILGPSPAFITKLHGKFRWHILLKGKNLHRFLKPVSSDWVIDVDPFSIL